MSGEESKISSEKLYEDANELMLNDEFESALNLYSDAIKNAKNADPNALFNYQIGRSQANIKLKKFQDAVSDADSAIAIKSTDSRAFLKKGIALFNLKEYQTSLDSLEEGKKLAENESEAKKHLFDEWIQKSKKNLLPPPKPLSPPSPPAPTQPPQAEETEPEPVQAKPEPEVKPEVKPAAPAIKHEWYQTESYVTISIMAKNIHSNDVKIETKENSLCVQSTDPEKLKINFFFNLEHSVCAESTQIKFMSTKVEIRLKKTEPIHWSKLINDPNERPSKAVGVQIKTTEKRPEYPSSSKKAVNWDKLAADLTAEEKDEKLEGDAALNKLFRDIYAGGSEETRKAMNKSFMESGGTVLSTNWNEIGTKKVDVKAPDGMEWKTWDK